MSLYQRLLGHPFVFNRIRPLFVGGIDWTPLYRALDAGPDDVVLDVGCGTGIAHQYMHGFREYHGFDTDPAAIAYARKTTTGSKIAYECRRLVAEDVKRVRPSKILLSGLLHHLADAEATDLLTMCKAASTLTRIATADTVYLPSQYLSNLLAFLDRGRHTRRTEGYLQLASDAGLDVVRHEIVRSHPKNGLALYLIMTLSPK